ncbi:hypothetical protein Aph02nite_74960 [Actinoplanes philippinensis]|uniref:Uncharacterized protein n=1 Tax=Actinoplanes philippinensis TaxID=35752 RepID=A0A1I2K5H3_9ACTN|nr:hypothetical protein [Actinoplanes philippinensis]GIE81546.1 hypothetical protein Aph02nite_74960 [Actinoplanes philippinensis]SFF62435.1 hypothetical protein SAMN05421541_115155 [Actinoplanes philippinensis]
MTFPSGDPWGVPSSPPASETPASPEPSGPVIAEIAEMQITSTTVRTPVGDLPLAGSRWVVTDHWLSQRRTPTWARIVAFGGICFTAGLSLFLLLFKEAVAQGTVSVTVTSGQHQYVSRVPVRHEDDVNEINQQVNYIRSLAAL